MTSAVARSQQLRYVEQHNGRRACRKNCDLFHLGLLQLAKQRLAVLAVPMPVVAEWWRGRSDVRERILDVVNVEPLTLAVAKAAGEGQAALRSSTAIDAIVMAFAASRGDVVFTGDLKELERLRRVFPSVRVLGCGEDPA